MQIQSMPFFRKLSDTKRLQFENFSRGSLMQQNVVMCGLCAGTLHALKEHAVDGDLA